MQSFLFDISWNDLYWSKMFPLCFLRIKSIWEEFLRKWDTEFFSSKEKELIFDALPNDYASYVSRLMDRVSVAIEQLGVEAYQSSQPFFDKRSKALDQLHKDKLTHYRESEIPADRSIENLDSEVMDIQQELQSLADQNAKLLIQNSELKGRQSVFEDVKVNAANESKTVTQLKD
jgi:hypothetical protein